MTPLLFSLPLALSLSTLAQLPPMPPPAVDPTAKECGVPMLPGILPMKPLAGPTSSPKTEAPAPAPSPTPPVLYYLKDASGANWSSPDPAWLSVYVGRRNAAMVGVQVPVQGTGYRAAAYQSPAYRYFSPSPARSSCSSGVCR